jgi:hypothetical protein
MGHLELIPQPLLPRFAGIFDLTREGDKSLLVFFIRRFFPLVRNTNGKQKIF